MRAGALTLEDQTFAWRKPRKLSAPRSDDREPRAWPWPANARHAPVAFPGDHGGFLGGEYGQTGESDAFAATLHKVLAATSL